jgi:hypothetical protein
MAEEKTVYVKGEIIWTEEDKGNEGKIWEEKNKELMKTEMNLYEKYVENLIKKKNKSE